MASSRPTRIFAGGGHYANARGERYRGGLFRRSPGDADWESLKLGLPADVEARAFAVHPHNSDVIFVGTQDGPYRTTDGGTTWERVGFPVRNAVIWAITYHPTNPKIMYAGTAPVALYRSDDGGDNWRLLPGAKSPGHCEMGFPCRTIRIAVDPNRPDDVYAALEVSGVIRSSDGGETWTDISDPLIRLANNNPKLKSKIGSDFESEGMLDSHAIVVSPAAPGAPILAVRMGLFRGDDRGAAWSDIEVGRHSPLTYCRDVLVSPHNPKTLYACLSPASRSTDGMLWRSDDLGGSWRRVDHDIKANATMMAVDVHRQDPKRVYCISRCGQVFGTEDEGGTWTEYPLPADVKDCYAVACV